MATVVYRPTTSFSNGITLGTSTDALDDYQEGAITPELWDNTLATEGTPPTYTLQTGSYTKIGNRVFFELRVKISALGGLTTSENIRVGGLPFASSSTVNTETSINAGWASALTLPAVGTSIGGYINPNTSYIVLSAFDATTGATALLVSEFGANGGISITGQYIV